LYIENKNFIWSITKYTTLQPATTPTTPLSNFKFKKGRRGRDRMVVGFITTYAISAYDH